MRLLLFLFLLGINSFIYAESSKISVGVVPFQDKSSDGASRYVQEIQTLFTTDLVQAHKFKVMERVDLKDLDIENLRQNSMKAKLRNVNFLVMGNITKAKLENHSGSFLGIGGSSQRAFLGLDIKLVNAQTGQIVLSEHVEKDTKGNTSVQLLVAGGGENKDLLEGLSKITADYIARVIANEIYPPKVISVDGKSLILNYGKFLFHPGFTGDVVELGASIKDPDTGAVIGHKRKKIGQLIIKDVTDKYSNAVFMGKKDIKSGDIVISLKENWQISDSKLNRNVKKAIKVEEKSKKD